MNAPNRLKHGEIKKRAFADGFRVRAQVQRDHNVLVSTGVQNCPKGTHREAPTASIHGHDDASVFRPNDADRRGRLSYGTPVFTNEPQQFEATTISRAHHPRIQDPA